MHFHLPEPASFKGQQLTLSYDRLSAPVHLAENDTDLIHDLPVIQLQKHEADLSGSAECGILRRIQEGSFNGDAPAHEVLSAVFSHHK